MREPVGFAHSNGQFAIPGGGYRSKPAPSSLARLSVRIRPCGIPRNSRGSERDRLEVRLAPALATKMKNAAAIAMPSTWWEKRSVLAIVVIAARLMFGIAEMNLTGLHTECSDTHGAAAIHLADREGPGGACACTAGFVLPDGAVFTGDSVDVVGNPDPLP